MSKLKILSQDDLSTISDKFGEILEKEVSKAISMKELGVLFDELSEITQDQVVQAIDEAYLKFDSYIDDNFRV